MNKLNNTELKLKVYYDLICDFYDKRKAKRSQVPYINHINEGLQILDLIGKKEDWLTKAVYCIHPIIQHDYDLENELYYNYDTYLNDSALNYKVLLLAMEYRSIANSYLSGHQNAITEEQIEYIKNKLNSFPEVKYALIADKIQNRKDFDLFYSKEDKKFELLDSYFLSWMKLLEIDTAKYLDIITRIKDGNH